MTVPLLLRQFVNVRGISTELLSMRALVPDALLQVLVVPGNPGNASYYVPFMAEVHAMFKGHADVVSVSHAGHDTGPENSGEKLYDLEDQIQHKMDVINTQLLLPGRPPLVILAHSIGAYMAVHAVTRLEKLAGAGGSSISVNGSSADGLEPGLNENSTIGAHSIAPVEGAAARQQPVQPQTNGCAPPILRVVALMPFFQAAFSTSWSQRWLRTVAARFELMGRLTRGISATPGWLQERLIRFWTSDGLDPHAIATTRALLHPPSVRNNFHLAHHEFKDLDRPFDWGLLRDLGSRVHVVACPQDMWMPHEQYEHMLSQVPGLQATWAEDLTHAFCVSAQQCVRVANFVADMVLGPEPLPHWIAAQRKAVQAAQATMAAVQESVGQGQSKDEEQTVKGSSVEDCVQQGTHELQKEEGANAREADGAAAGKAQVQVDRLQTKAEAAAGVQHGVHGKVVHVTVDAVVHGLRVMAASEARPPSKL